jgi:hypothetical protein
MPMSLIYAEVERLERRDVVIACVNNQENVKAGPFRE